MNNTGIPTVHAFYTHKVPIMVYLYFLSFDMKVNLTFLNQTKPGDELIATIWIFDALQGEM
jgi:hypothetical protein